LSSRAEQLELLRDALATGANATGIDHSEDMVELARERAPSARGARGRQPAFFRRRGVHPMFAALRSG
jgi:trans-aconitate methyltransferase